VRGDAARRVVLTRAAGSSDELAARLRQVGLEVAECPLIRIEPIPGVPLRVDGYDWLVLTSRNAVEALFERLDGPLPRVAVIGPGTAEALGARGIEPALVARRSTQEGLVEELPRPAGRVLFAGAEDARDVLVRELGADFVPLYRTVELRPQGFPADADLVVLASPSAARSFAALSLDLPCVSIGPVTSEEARRLGIRVLAEAETHDLDGLAAAVKLAASSIASSRS
jgi:uroporphyrinogen III methyltransferase / synthase